MKGHTVPYLSVISIMASIEYKLKLLVSHTDVEKSALERSFFKSESETNLISFNDVGIDALDRLARNNRLHEIKIRDYTKELIKERLDVLTGSNKSDYRSFETMVLSAIFEKIKTEYDVNFVNVNGSLDNQFNREIIEKSDMVVVCINQNLWMLESYFNNDSELRNLIDSKKHIYVIGNYDKDSKYSLNNIRRKFRLKKNVYAIPYNIGYFDALNDSKAIDFVLKNAKCKKHDFNYDFIESTRGITKAILDSVDIDTKVKSVSGGVA